jgi:23S rRNA (cytidine1920-2'-O)/16S rRNA (cytidine1409-2'-O)-methyltransferase
VTRRRLDTLLTERGLAPSRSAAATSIRAGLVRIGRGGERASKPGQLVPADLEVELEGGRRYVSRGGHKLEAALDALAADPTGLDCLDVGASTGGFTECLLRRGAARVVALDVGRGQLDWGLRNDPRVTVLEGLNARALQPEQLPFAPELVTVDVSFISLGKLLAPLASAIDEGGIVLAMVKPQFELGPDRVGRGGVVRDRADRIEAVRGVAKAGGRMGLGATGVAPAGLPGPKGNRETFLRLERGEGLAAAELEQLLGEAVA